MLEVLQTVLPVFLVIGLGYSLGRGGLFTERDNSRFSWFVFYVSAPALLFRSAAETPFSQALNLRLWAALGSASVVFAILVYLAAARTSPSRRGVLAQGAFRSNMVFVGLPIIMNAFGDRALGPVSVLIGLTVPVYNLLAVLVLVLPHQGGESSGKRWLSTAKSTLLNPLILGSAGGLVFSFFGLSLPRALSQGLDLVGRVAMPLALVCVGQSIDFGKLRGEFWPAVLISLLKLAAYPALVLLLLLVSGESGLNLQFTVLLSAAPTAVASHIMAMEMKGDTKLSASIVIASTLLSLFTITGWLLFFRVWGPLLLP